MTSIGAYCRTPWLLLALAAATPGAHAEIAEVGLAAVDIEPAIGIPLAGYGAKVRRYPGGVDWTNQTPGVTYFKPSVGRHSPIRSKAMVIRAKGQHIVIVSVDFVGVEWAMTKDLVGRTAHLGVTTENLVLGGTHTHHGPGATTRRFALAIVAVDKFHPDIYDSILDKVEESVEQAFDALEPAELLAGSFETEGIQRNKFRRIGEGHYDNTARLLLARSAGSGNLLGGIVNYPLHGNGMPVSDLRFSSDVLGQIELNMEQVIADANDGAGHRPVMLFLNAAQGDVGNPVRTEEAVMADGASFARFAVDADVLGNLRRVEPEISSRQSRVWLGMPAYSPKVCARKGSFLDKYGLGLKIPLPLLYPQRTYLTAVTIGDIMLLTLPGEASTQVGYNLRHAVESLGYDTPWLIGLANDYMSYFTTREEYRQGHYDSCSSLFSWKGADRIEAKYIDLLQADRS